MGEEFDARDSQKFHSESALRRQLRHQTASIKYANLFLSLYPLLPHSACYWHFDNVQSASTEDFLKEATKKLIKFTPSPPSKFVFRRRSSLPSALTLIPEVEGGEKFSQTFLRHSSIDLAWKNLNISRRLKFLLLPSSSCAENSSSSGKQKYFPNQTVVNSEARTRITIEWKIFPIHPT